MKSPLRYPGGKQRLVKEIASRVPELVKEYREPFAGGASVLLHLKQTRPTIQHWWLNDLFEPLTLFWTYVRDYPDGLTLTVNSIKNKGADKEFKNHLVAEYQSMCDLERAATFFALNRMTYSGLTFSGGFSKAAWNDRFKDSHINHIQRVSEVLQDVKITQKDYSELLAAQGSQVFLYLDPPYDIGSSNLYGVRGSLHQGFCHQEFAERCKDSEHRWLVTYNDSPEIRRLFSWANIAEVPVKYSINSKGTNKTELFITNY